ncbi:choline/ethanolamine kinase family protein [Microbulbifer agarilyticus]|uniref:choline/ethanolamine kinase family protein n=1 Tax=Microbulbifer agarilyticus TaxID=260552 RepID=UPI001CD650E6|nr:choline/ethanolamine kinase family protein [Microbulbifer agarilyticus]MCA0901711.1 phosphotransferase family protein [Microbulbifer agarilyticus]
MIPWPAEVIPDDWRRWSLAEPELIRPLTNGLTNRSFLLSTVKGKVVLRWNSPISVQLDLDRRAEAQALQLARGLSAPLVYCDPDQRYLVTQFIDGKVWPSGPPDTHLQLCKLARLTRSIHQLPTIDLQLDINAKISAYRQSIGNDQQGLRQLNRDIHAHIISAEAMGDHKVLCHNDLQRENLISDRNGQLYAIDWEYAATGDPFYELAVIAEEHHLQGARLEAFLTEYLRRPAGKHDFLRLSHWRVIYTYLTLLWYAVQLSQDTMPEVDSGTKIKALKQHLSNLLQGF